MNNICSIVRDLLPLYLENMVSEDTASFIKEHLEQCPDCCAEFESMKTGIQVDAIGDDFQSKLDTEVLKSMKGAHKSLHKKVWRMAVMIAFIAIIVCILLYCFDFLTGPMTTQKYYASEKIATALHIGSDNDRAEVQAVLQLAEKAFYDTQHTTAENEKEYGALARYATPTDIYADAAYNEHSLDLWSVHLGQNVGWMWVYYSSETFDYDGNTVRGSWRIPSLWKVERDDSRKWVVVQIFEHP